jgi:integrase
MRLAHFCNSDRSIFKFASLNEQRPLSRTARLLTDSVKWEIETAGRDFPAKQEASLLITEVGGRWRPLIITAIFTGMRASELRGLTWDMVDFDERELRVRKRADRWNVMGEPKSAAGHREIPMSPMVVNTLKEWRLACPKGGQNLVFPNGAGNVESHSNIANRGFYALQTAIGMVDDRGRPKYGMHSLRHFFASWAIEHGYTPKELQSFLGHSSIVMTLDRYGHLFPNKEDDQEKFARAERELLATTLRPAP